MTLFLLFLAGVAVAQNTPWPAIPRYTPGTATANGPVYVYPTSIASGLTDESSNSSDTSLVFSSVGQTYTLDYGRAVAGKATFEIEALSDDYAQIEVKYTESYNGLLVPQGDGPFAFVNSLAATFRVETFNLTSPGNFTSYFIQGSQRWQSVTLVKGSNLTISRIGFESSIDETPISSFPGYFASSNKSYTDIWNLGPRTQQLVCLAPGTQTSTWDVTENGVYVRGQKPATSPRVINLSNYTLSFETMIDFGGVGWRLDTEIDTIEATGPLLVLTSEYPDGSFVNIDRALVPPNTLVLGRGWSFQNQTSLPGFVLEKFALQMNVTEKTWHTIETQSFGDGTYEVRLDGTSIASFNISSYGLGDPNPFIPGGYYKSFALGPWQDQAAYYRNVNITLNSGELVYSNPMTTEDTLEEYGVATLNTYVCSDAGKRDRYSWIGDRLFSGRAVYLGSNQLEYVWGPAEEAFSRQNQLGQVPVSTLFSPQLAADAAIRTVNLDPLILDYLFDFMSTIHYYWMHSGNDTFLVDHWDQMVGVMSYSMSRTLDQVTQLFGAPFGPNGVPLSGEKGQALGPANTISMILGLENMAEMAAHIGHTDAAAVYQKQANLSRAAIDSLLWNATGGFYASTIGAPGFDLTDVGLVLQAQIGTTERRSQFLSHLDELRVPAGYFNGTRFADTPLVVSPYYEGFLLEGLAVAKETFLAQDLLDRTWLPMVRRDRNFTGAYWEYLSTDGTYPGLDLFSASSHFWVSMPNAFLTEYVLGVRPTSPGYASFVFEPLRGWNSEWVSGRIPTPKGLIYAAWGVQEGGKIVMQIEAPAGVSGQVVVPWDGTSAVGNETGVTGTITVNGGSGYVTITEE